VTIESGIEQHRCEEVDDMQDNELYQWAHARARQLRAFYLHAGIYAAVMLFLVVVNAITRDEPGGYMYGGHMYHQMNGDWWVIWPALGWGVIVAIHGIVVALGGTGRLDAWEDRKVEELVRREQQRSVTTPSTSEDSDAATHVDASSPST
jgi:hypothetical protein